MFRIFTILIEIPALQAFTQVLKDGLAYLMASDQAKIDRATALLIEANAKLKRSREALQAALPKK